MATYIVFNTDSGEILGRIMVSDDSPMVNRADAVKVSSEDYDTAPELWGEVDLITKKLKARPGKPDPRKRP